jgi:hypothetical protein
MTVVRWELARLGLGALARAVTYDTEPTSADGSVTSAGLLLRARASGA